MELKTQPKPTDVIETLANLNRGNFLIECGRKMAELVEAAGRTRKKGKIVITLELLPTGISPTTGQVNQFEISPVVEIKKPEITQPGSIFFCDESGRLTRDDPDQMQMDYNENKQEQAK